MAPAPGSAIHGMLVRGLEFLASAQLERGEMPAYRRGASGSLEYVSVLLVSACIHDALGCFDPLSMWFEPQACEHIDAPSRARFFRVVSGIRRGIRGFLAWQQDPRGAFRFFGRDSSLSFDPDTTACALTSLLDSPTGPTDVRCDALEPAQGLLGSPAQLIPRLNALRYLVLSGAGEPDGLAAGLEHWLGEEDLRAVSGTYAGTACFFFVLARTFRQARLPGLDRVASLAVPRVLLLAKAGEFTSSLSIALAASALLDFAYDGDMLHEAAAVLGRHAEASGVWGFEEFCGREYGSPALTTALSMTVLARVAAPGEGLV